jgi:hypothetical protein
MKGCQSFISFSIYIEEGLQLVQQAGFVNHMDDQRILELTQDIEKTCIYKKLSEC